MLAPVCMSEGSHEHHQSHWPVGTLVFVEWEVKVSTNLDVFNGAIDMIDLDCSINLGCLINVGHPDVYNIVFCYFDSLSASDDDSGLVQFLYNSSLEKDMIYK